MARKSKTNAIRILERQKIEHELLAYEADETDLSAAHLAQTMGLDVGQVFKTLVLAGDKTGPVVCVLPGDDEVDLKKAAKVSGNKSCSMLPLRDLQALTGYVRGGCSPVGMKKAFPTYIHEAVRKWSAVYVSAGQRGLQCKLAPDDLVTATGGKIADLALEKN